MNLKLNKKSFDSLMGLSGMEGIKTVEYDISGRKVSLIDVSVESSLSAENMRLAAKTVAEAAMGCLGRVDITESRVEVDIPEHPGLATLGCQLAGWAIDVAGRKRLGSGPARITACKPKDLMNGLGYEEKTDVGALVLETGRMPSKEECEKILYDSRVDHLAVAAFSDKSYVGLINVLARVVEVGIFRLHNIGYEADRIKSAKGSVPKIALSDDAMFDSNDAIIYHGMVSLEVRGWAEDITKKAVSSASKDYGRKFKEIFEASGGDFYKIDHRIFAPSFLEVVDLDRKACYWAGKE